MADDEPPDRGGHKPHHDKRRGEAAENERLRPAEIARDTLTEHADQIIGDAPEHELRHAEPPDEAPLDHRGAPSPAPRARCISTVSSQRPCFQPTARKVPTSSN